MGIPRITGKALFDKALIVATLVAIVAALFSGLLYLGGASGVNLAAIGTASFVISFATIAVISMAVDWAFGHGFLRYWKQALGGAFVGALGFAFLAGMFGLSAVSFSNIWGVVEAIILGTLGIWIGYELVEKL